MSSDVPIPPELPPLSRVHRLTPEKREEALAAWVTWVNGNRDRVGPELEKKLDQALAELRESRRPSVDLDSLHSQLDGWLEQAGSVGAGKKSM